jgi:hypothetical protein
MQGCWTVAFWCGHTRSFCVYCSRTRVDGSHNCTIKSLPTTAVAGLGYVHDWYGCSDPLARRHEFSQAHRISGYPRHWRWDSTLRYILPGPCAASCIRKRPCTRILCFLPELCQCEHHLQFHLIFKVHIYLTTFLFVVHQVWGVTIGTAVLQTQLGKRLPPSFTEQFPQGVAIAYQIIPVIPDLPEPARGAVREAYASSLIVLWQVMIGISGLGLLSSLFMKALPLHTQRDDQWAFSEDSSHDPERTVFDHPTPNNG